MTSRWPNAVVLPRVEYLVAPALVLFSAVASYILTSRHGLMGVAVLAVLGAMFVALPRWSPASAAGLLLVLLVVVPIKELNSAHEWAYLSGAALLCYVLPRLHGRSSRTPFRFWLLVPGASTLLAYLAGGGKDALHGGLVTGTVILAGMSLGGGATARGKVSVLRTVTALGVATSIIGLVEYARGAALYYFSPLQVWSPFRASGLLIHPLILASVASAVIATNLAMPAKQRVALVLSVGIPSLGAIATVSRSISYLIAGGVIAGLVARREANTRQRVTTLGVMFLGVLVVTQTPLTGSLADRFQRLSSAEQGTRLNALHLAGVIVHGYQNVIGGGAGYVAIALQDSPQLLRENHGYNTLDNGFLGAFTDFGLLGLAGLLLAACLLVRALRSRTATAEQRYAAVLGIVLVLCNVSFEALRWPVLLFLTAWSVGAASRAAPNADPQESVLVPADRSSAGAGPVHV